jgi:hypothetical protein
MLSRQQDSAPKLGIAVASAGDPALAAVPRGRFVVLRVVRARLLAIAVLADALSTVRLRLVAGEPVDGQLLRQT